MKHISENKRNEGTAYYETDTPGIVRAVKTVFEDIDVGAMKKRVAELEKRLAQQVPKPVDAPESASEEVLNAIAYYNAMTMPGVADARERAEGELAGLNAMLSGMDQ